MWSLAQLFKTGCSHRLRCHDGALMSHMKTCPICGQEFDIAAELTISPYDEFLNRDDFLCKSCVGKLKLMVNIGDAGAFDILELEAMIFASQGNSEEAFSLFLQWATQTRVNAVILDEILRGETVISISADGSPMVAGRKPKGPHVRIRESENLMTQPQPGGDMLNEDETVLQITVAKGSWYALFVDTNDVKYACPVVCWALIDKEGTQYVKGLMPVTRIEKTTFLWTPDEVMNISIHHQAELDKEYQRLIEDGAGMADDEDGVKWHLAFAGYTQRPGGAEIL